MGETMIPADDPQARRQLAAQTAAGILRGQAVVGPLSTSRESLVTDVDEVLRLAEWLLTGVDPVSDSDSRAVPAAPALAAPVPVHEARDLEPKQMIGVAVEIELSDVRVHPGTFPKYRLEGTVIDTGPNCGSPISITVEPDFVVAVLAPGRPGDDT